MKKLLVPLILLAFGCHTKQTVIKPQIIEGITLGNTYQEYLKELDSLGVKKEDFFSQILLNSKEDFENNGVSTYVTKIFNFQEFESPSIKHIGILWPTVPEATNRLIGLTVLLAHTTEPVLDEQLFSNNSHIKSIVQDINENLKQKIITSYISKYGEPKRRKTKNFYFFTLDGYKTNKNFSDLSTEAEILTWQSKFYTITFFTGTESRNCVYSPLRRNYSETLLNYKPISEPLSVSVGEIQCFSNCYIQYNLTDKAQKEFGIVNNL